MNQLAGPTEIWFGVEIEPGHLFKIVLLWMQGLCQTVPWQARSGARPLLLTALPVAVRADMTNLFPS